MKKKKSKIRQNKYYNKKSKFRRKKSKKKMIGGSIYDTQEDQNVELSKENERLKIQLAEANGFALKHAAEVDRLKQELSRRDGWVETLSMLARKRLKTINDQTKIINYIKEMARNTELQDSHKFLETVRKVLT